MATKTKEPQTIEERLERLEEFVEENRRGIELTRQVHEHDSPEALEILERWVDVEDGPIPGLRGHLLNLYRAGDSFDTDGSHPWDDPETLRACTELSTI